MKTILVIGIYLLTTTGIYAQSGKVQYGTASFNGMSEISSSIEIENIDESVVTKKWVSYLKDFNGKVKNHKGEIFADNAKIPAISSDTLDIFSTVDESGDDVIIKTGINLNGKFINNADGHFVAVDDLLLRFATSILKDKAEIEFANAEKILKELEKDLREISDKNKKLESGIVEMKSDIADNERSIKENEKSIDGLNGKIREQDTIVKSLKAKVGDYK